MESLFLNTLELLKAGENQDSQLKLRTQLFLFFFLMQSEIVDLEKLKVLDSFSLNVHQKNLFAHRKLLVGLHPAERLILPGFHRSASL
jgi:hypothetical protein